jgi:hypothetical protein
MRPVYSETKTAVATDYGVIPFDPVGMKPIAHAARLYQRALDDYGMTEPDPYVAPPPRQTA